MQDANVFDRPALSLDEVRALAARVAAVVHERDALLAEVRDLRQILDAIEALRELLDHDASGVMTVAGRNGHPATAVRSADPTAALTPTESAGDDAPELEPDMPAAMMETDDRRDETDTVDANPSQLEKPAAERQGEPGRPPENTLLSRILQLFEESAWPLSRWDAQKLLGLPRMPSAELSRLTQQGHLLRISEGVYAAR